MKKNIKSRVIKSFTLFLICFLLVITLDFKTTYAQKRDMNNLIYYENDISHINMDTSQILLSGINISPDTGDDGNIQKYIDIICIAGIGLIILLIFNIGYSLIKLKHKKLKKNKMISDKKTDNSQKKVENKIEVINDSENIRYNEVDNDNFLNDKDIENIYRQIKDSITL